jgi:hypothetical protein
MGDGNWVIGGRLTTARTYNDLLGSFTAATGGAGASFVTFIGATKVNRWSVGDGVHFSMQETHSWDGGAISPHLHFSVEPGVAAGNVKFRARYVYCDSTGLWSAEQTDNLEVAVTTDGTKFKMYRRRFLDVTIPNWEPSTESEWYIDRVAASSAEFGGDVFMHWFDIHEPRTTLGTDTAVVVTP